MKQETISQLYAIILSGWLLHRHPATEALPKRAVTSARMPIKMLLTARAGKEVRKIDIWRLHGRVVS
jgi:hypothetical protein